ncbi:MAG TPA: hypothetical protein VGN88_12760, partial [Phycisphaerae bacterium]
MGPRQYGILFGTLLAALWAVARPAAADLQVLIHTDEAGAEISDDFLGLSYETAQVMPRADGSHYFSPGNKPLIALFRTLGVKSLRIGGNSVDRAETGLPVEGDIDSLFQFAKEAGVKVIYSVRLKDGEAAPAARTARYIAEHYGETLDCFAIGNEPSYL